MKIQTTLINVITVTFYSVVFDVVGVHLKLRCFKVMGIASMTHHILQLRELGTYNQDNLLDFTILSANQSDLTKRADSNLQSQSVEPP